MDYYATVRKVMLFVLVSQLIGLEMAVVSFATLHFTGSSVMPH